jgi:hypothetical protein
MIKNMITERHNIASRITNEALNKGADGTNLVYIDVGSNTVAGGTRFSDKGLDTTGVVNRTLPAWLLPNLSELERKEKKKKKPTPKGMTLLV